MRRCLAFAWLAMVAVAGVYLGWRVQEGLAFRTDLTALLPREEQDVAVQRSEDTATRSLAQKLIFLVGSDDRGQARSAAAELARRLRESGLADLAGSNFDKDKLAGIGAAYFPHRRGLLSDTDRGLLLQDRADRLAARALSQIYGFVGLADGRLVRNDPFLLLQDFITGLPLPLSRLALDDGWLSTRQDGKTWVMLAATLTGEPFALEVQRRLTAALDLDGLQAGQPGVEILRLGGVFFAQAGAEQAMSETSTIGLLSTAGTILVVLLVFRALSPLWSSLLVIGVGVLVALSFGLWAFGELHVGALLFGVSLIGVAVDYSLQYCAEVFAAEATPAVRLRRVFTGIGLGTATTVIGYLTFFLAPFPGLHQIAAFSAVGLVAAWLTVVLWLPHLDRAGRPRHGAGWLVMAGRFLEFWSRRRFRPVHLGLAGLGVIVALAGTAGFRSEDDVRRMQSLAPSLVAQQERIQQLIGAGRASQFFLVGGQDEETALQREEALAERLQGVVRQGGLAGFQALAQYVPSAARQMDNRRLVAERLDPLLPAQLARLGIAEPPAADSGKALSLPDVAGTGGALGFLGQLRLGPGLHLVALEGVHDLAAVAKVAAGLEGVRLIDPAAQFSLLLGKYRVRALGLLAISAALMIPLLWWRYGGRGTFWVMLPPVLAVVLTPALRALAGGGFTFFDAMGLVLVLSIGVDYAVFCAETGGDRKPVTMLAVAMAASTALMSFGLLALSRVMAVHAFGTTMLIGILLAFLLAPLARRGIPEAIR